jgi:hypothetical protein
MTREEALGIIRGMKPRIASPTAHTVASIPFPQMKIGIRIPRALGFRLWLGMRLMSLAGRVFGKTIKVEVEVV